MSEAYARYEKMKKKSVDLRCRRRFWEELSPKSLTEHERMSDSSAKQG
jgi:hypothetical protein